MAQDEVSRGQKMLTEAAQCRLNGCPCRSMQTLETAAPSFYSQDPDKSPATPFNAPMNMSIQHVRGLLFKDLTA